MKYLIHFRPDSDLSDLIQLQDNLKLPPLGVYCAVCQFEMDPKKEGMFIGKYKKLHMHPFELRTLDFSDDFTTGLLLTNPPELQKLHKEAVRLARDYCEDVRRFDETARMFYYDRYVPHIPLLRNGEFDTNSPDARELLGRSFEVTDLHLAKEAGRWITVVSLHTYNHEHA
jgi:hypothetical protein